MIVVWRWDGQQAVRNCIMNCIVHHLFLFGCVTLSHSADDYYDDQDYDDEVSVIKLFLSQPT